MQQAVAKLGSATLVVKPHPDDRTTIFDDPATDPDFQVTRDADPIDFISRAHAVIVATSTAGFEACALDRPVVAFALPGMEHVEEYEAFGSGLVASDATEVEAAVRAIRVDPAVREQLRAGRAGMSNEIFAGLAPGAAGRCANEILSKVTARSPDA